MKRQLRSRLIVLGSVCAVVGANRATSADEVWQSLGGGVSAGGGVRAVIEYNGGLVAGGWFDEAGGTPVNNIARWDGSSWHALGAGIDGPVIALAVYNGDLIAGGTFLQAGGEFVNNIARWDGNAWHAMDGGMAGTGSVLCLEVYNGNLIAGGEFTTAGGQTVNGIARWDGSTWHALSADGYTGVEGAPVESLRVWQGDLIVGGEFETAGGQIVNGIVRWDGTAWHPLISGGNVGVEGGIVSSLAVYGNDLIAGGLFMTAGGQTVNNIARWDGSSWHALGSGTGGPAGQVLTMMMYGGDLVIGGRFTIAGGQAASRIAGWNGSAWKTYGLGMNSDVECLTIWSGYLIASGNFETAGGQTVNGIARTSASGSASCTTWHVLGAGMDGFVYDLVEYEGNLIAGGSFIVIGGEPMWRIAQWDGSSWQPIDDSFAITSGNVNALAVWNGDLIAGGDFHMVGDQTVNSIARWDGSAWHALTSGGQIGVNGPVQALTIWNDDLIAAGNFQTAGGQMVSRIARWDGTEWHPFSVGVFVGVSGSVNALTVYDGDLIAGGYFALAGGQTVNSIARWDGLAWHPFTSGGQVGVDAGFSVEPITTLAVHNGALFAAGRITSAGGQLVNRIARWDGAAWHPLGSGVDDVVRDLIVHQGDLVAAGGFSTAGGQGVNFAARWDGSAWRSLGPGSNQMYSLALFQGQLVAGVDLGVYEWKSNRWWQPLPGSYSDDANWEYPFVLDAPALFGIEPGATAFAVDFSDFSQSSELCVGNQRPIFNLNGHTHVVTNFTTIGGSETAHLTVNNGTLVSPSVEVGSFGTLCGDGDIIGNVFNAGTVCPGDSTGQRGGGEGGALSILGNYRQESAAILRTSLHTNHHSSLVIDGTASLRGTLQIVIPSGEQPSGGYSILDASSVDPQQSRFGLAYATGLPAGKLAIVEYPSERVGDERGPGGGGVTITIVSFDDNFNLSGPAHSSVSGIASSAILADFNNDSYLDIALTIPSFNGVGILLNEGGVGNTYTQLPMIAVGSAPADLVAAHLNRGSAIDLAVANEGDDSVSILMNDGSGNFTVSQVIGSVGSSPVSIAAGDFDVVNRMDLAVANRDSNTVRLLDNNGSGSFSLGTTLLVGVEPLHVVAADLDADTRPDLLVVNGGSNDLMIFYNSGSRSFGSQANIAVGSRPIRIIPEDLDNDKDVDIVVLNSNSLNVSLIVNNGGSYSASTPMPTSGTALWMTAGDMDDDGDADLVLVIDHPVDGQIVQILRNDSTEQGQSQITFSLHSDSIGQGTNPLIVLSGDVNSDGRDDLITINGESNPRASGAGGSRGVPQGSVSVQLSDVPVNLCPADIVPPGGDGQVTIADITFVLSVFGMPCNGCPQDVVPFPDGDGQVTIADVTFVLTAFGPCP